MKRESAVSLLAGFLIVLSVVSAGYGMTVMGYAKKGEEYLNKKQYDKAIINLTRAIETGGLNAGDLAITYSNRGVAYSGKKQYKRAIADFNKAIELDPGYSGAYYNKACLYSLRKKAPEACKWLNAAIEKGFDDQARLKTDRDLDNIRNSSCFKRLISGRSSIQKKQ